MLLFSLFETTVPYLKLAHVSSESHALPNSSAVPAYDLSRVTVLGGGSAPKLPLTMLSSDDDLLGFIASKFGPRRYA